jgi:hypothetical protein
MAALAVLAVPAVVVPMPQPKAATVCPAALLKLEAVLVVLAAVVVMPVQLLAYLELPVLRVLPEQMVLGSVPWALQASPPQLQVPSTPPLAAVVASAAPAVLV